MRPGFADLLRCSRCRSDGALTLDPGERDAREVRTGELICGACGARFAVREGIAELLEAPPGFVEREAAGLERFAAVMRADGWDRERILALPDVDLPYWHGQARGIRRVLAEADFRPGQRLVDVGSNTCWASNIFAREGLEVVALDISTAELQGLRTADVFLEAGEAHFERLLSVMFDPALADASMDYAFCCEVLHHNDAGNLRRTLGELYRILKPGGRLFVVNEPLRFPLRLKRDHGEEIAAFDGYEHVYFLHQYVLAARRAGFRVRITGLDEHGGSAWRRWARFAWRHAIAGDANLSMTCEKPA